MTALRWSNPRGALHPPDSWETTKGRGITGYAERAMKLLADRANPRHLLDVRSRAAPGEPIGPARQALPAGVDIAVCVGKLARVEPPGRILLEVGRRRLQALRIGEEGSAFGHRPSGLAEHLDEGA